MNHFSKYCKEYFVALIMIGLAGLFTQIDLFGFLNNITGNVIGYSSLTSIVSVSYLALVVVGPMLLVGMASLTYYQHRVEEHNAYDFDKVKHASRDHELHGFPHNVIDFDKHKPGKRKLGRKNEIKPEFRTNITPKQEPVSEFTNAGLSANSGLLSYPQQMDHHMLKQHIKNKLVQGHTYMEIVEALEDYNWDTDKINRAYNDIKLHSNEAEIMLGSFVTRALIAGNKVNSIRQSLVNKGWDSKIVDKVINNVMG